MATPSITVAICTYNRHHLLMKTIKSLLQQELSKDEFVILIVDNSTDRKAAESFYKKTRLDRSVTLHWSTPGSLSHARNCALKVCSTPYIAYLDDDATPCERWLTSIISEFKRDSKIAAVGGPIMPIWTQGRPHWLPEDQHEVLSIYEREGGDQDLGPGRHLYGANMAFSVKRLNKTGGFPEQLGRKGTGTLLSAEELIVQEILREQGGIIRYITSAAVHHLVHEDRLRRNWLRSRMAWQSVSELMSDPPQVFRSWAIEELLKLSKHNSDIAAAVRLFFSPESHDNLSSQLNAIRHLISLLLSAHMVEDEENNAIAAKFNKMLVDSTNPSAMEKCDNYLPVSDAYAPKSAGAAAARYLFVEGTPGHCYLYDLYGNLSESHLLTYKAKDAWGSASVFSQNLAYVYRSIGPKTHCIFFITLDQALMGSNPEEFLRFVEASPCQVWGILHRPPFDDKGIHALNRYSHLGGKVVLLSEIMYKNARSLLGILNAEYLPLHPSFFQYPHSQERRKTARSLIGALPNHCIFSVLGEARHGKGIELLLNALPLIPVEERENMYFLFGGKGRHFTCADILKPLIQEGFAGRIDLRENSDEFHYSVLSSREYSNYCQATDVGLLLYQDEQSSCMSGVLGDYLWTGATVLATRKSYTGAEVHAHELGLLLTTETPEALADKLVEAARMNVLKKQPSAIAQAYISRISPESVLQSLQRILDPGRSSAESNADFLKFKIA